MNWLSAGASVTRRQRYLADAAPSLRVSRLVMPIECLIGPIPAAVEYRRRSPALLCWSVSPYMPISTQSSLMEAYLESRLCAEEA
jgi:hypothetical protein